MLSCDVCCYFDERAACRLATARKAETSKSEKYNVFLSLLFCITVCYIRI